MPSLESPQVGAPCVAKYLIDGDWYRGKIVGVTKTELEILFVDYGNSQRGPLDSAKVISEEFTKLPPQGYHCELNFDEDKKISDWTDAEKKRFDDFTIEKEKIYATFEKRDGSKYSIRLTDFQDGDWVDINKMFERIPPVKVSVACFSSVGKFFLLPEDQLHYVSQVRRSFFSILILLMCFFFNCLDFSLFKGATRRAG